MSYLEEQEKSGIKIGSLVIVKRTAYFGENGWGDKWTPSMDEYVDGAFEVTKISDKSGMRLSGGRFWFPYFVLEKLEFDDKKCKLIIINDCKVIKPISLKLVKNKVVIKGTKKQIQTITDYFADNDIPVTESYYVGKRKTVLCMSYQTFKQNLVARR